jgi:diguanylate cyclase
MPFRISWLPGSERRELPAWRETLYLDAVKRFLGLLGEAVAALQGQDAPAAPEAQLLDDLSARFAEGVADEEEARRAMKSLHRNCSTLASSLRRSTAASRARAEELSDVVSLLSRSVAEATRENVSFYRDIRAEGARIAEATQIDDLQDLRSVLRVAADKLDNLVHRKESSEQARIDALSDQVEQLSKELHEARISAQTDPLTGVLNRRAFDDELAAMFRRYRNARGRFTLILFDIDDFKRINDSFGHPVGDRVLIAFTQRCQNLLRPEDRLARFGGEEFALLMEGVSLRNGLKRARSICASIAAARYAVERGVDAPQLSVTVSAGVASQHRDDTAASLVERADRALYLAKQSGKNRAQSESDLDD